MNGVDGEMHEDLKVAQALEGDEDSNELEELERMIEEELQTSEKPKPQEDVKRTKLKLCCQSFWKYSHTPSLMWK